VNMDELENEIKALKEENETLKADKALLIKTVSAGVLTVQALDADRRGWMNRYNETQKQGHATYMHGNE